MDKPVVSPRFDLNDIRAIRDYNSYRHASMTHEEIIADIHEGAEEMLREIMNRPTRKTITILSADGSRIVEPPRQ